MGRTQFGIGSVIALALVALLGGMMLIPAPEADTRVAEKSALATSSSLSRFLDDAIERPQSNITSRDVVAEVAALPEPVAPVAVATPVVAPVKTPAPVAPQTAAVETTPVPATTPAATPVDAAALASAERIAVRTPVNMRSGPSTDESTLVVLPAREEVAILERNGSWARIARADGSTGWVYASYLGEDRSPAPTAKTASRDDAPRQAEPKGTPQIASLKLRAEPSSRARSITVLEPGTPLKVAERRPGWVRVIMPDGITGWVRTTN